MAINPRFDLNGRTVIVTGGGKGIGKVYAQEFAKAGAEWSPPTSTRPPRKPSRRRSRGEGLQALGLGTDIAERTGRPKRWRRPRSTASARIDVLINNASLMSVLPRRSWLEIPVEEWDRVMAVNLRGMFLCCRAVFPAMKAQKRGKIVNISSSRLFEGTPNRLHYTTSKAGVIGFTRALAREVGEFGITVNAVAPGMTPSETQVVVIVRAIISPRASPAAPSTASQVPEDLVGAVMFLSSRGERLHDRPDACWSTAARSMH